LSMVATTPFPSPSRRQTYASRLNLWSRRIAKHPMCKVAEKSELLMDGKGRLTVQQGRWKRRVDTAAMRSFCRCETGEAKRRDLAVAG
jgi:hypothetical protein